MWILAATARGLKLRAQASLRVVDRGVKDVGLNLIDFGCGARLFSLARELGEKLRGAWTPARGGREGGGSSRVVWNVRWFQVNSLPKGRIGLVVLGIDLEFIGRPRPLELSQSYGYLGP